MVKRGSFEYYIGPGKGREINASKPSLLLNRIVVCKVWDFFLMNKFIEKIANNLDVVLIY